MHPSYAGDAAHRGSQANHVCGYGTFWAAEPGSLPGVATLGATIADGAFRSATFTYWSAAIADGAVRNATIGYGAVWSATIAYGAATIGYGTFWSATIAYGAFWTTTCCRAAHPPGGYAASTYAFGTAA